jgi:peptidoglycan-associated lipoprotein
MNPHTEMKHTETNTLSNSTQRSTQRLSSIGTMFSCALMIATLSLSTGCGKKKASGIDPNSLAPMASTTVAAAPTATITADPVAIDLGQTVVLNWRTANATVVTIDGIGQVNTNGTQTVSPSSSTNFHLIAKGEGGITEANVRVTVRVPQVDRSGSTVLATDRKGGTVTDEQFKAGVSDMFFDYDSFDLRPDAQGSAAQSAAFLVAHPDLKVLIGGYADERGSAEYNLALGENRANAAKTGLVGAGIAAARIRVISYGKEKQFCTAANEACWQENRRAQITMDK